MFEHGDVVTIALESTTQTFSVQKALLCNASRYFTTALSGAFKESDAQTLKLPGCDEHTFRLFLYWLCNHKFPDPYKDAVTLTHGSEEKKAYITTQQLLLVKLWVFGDAYLLPRLQNDTMRRLLQLLQDTYIRAEAVQLAFTAAPFASKIREVAIAELVHSYGKHDQYGGLRYDDDDISLLAATPGLMQSMLQTLTTLDCCRVCANDGCAKKPAAAVGRVEERQYMVSEQ